MYWDEEYQETTPLGSRMPARVSQLRERKKKKTDLMPGAVAMLASCLPKNTSTLGTNCYARLMTLPLRRPRPRPYPEFPPLVSHQASWKKGP